MSRLPIPLPDDPPSFTPRQLAKAKRAQTDTEIDLFRYQLQARLRAEIDRIDSEAIADAARAALQEELSLLADGLARAGNSQAALEILSRKLEIVSSANNRRLARRFAG
jgi:hypothetical protein